MPISHEHKLFLIHVPKTAGTSIQETLKMDYAGHHTPQQLKKKFPKEWETYKKFAVIRNPWDRMVSNYYYILAEKSFWFDNISPMSKQTIRPKVNGGHLPAHQLRELCIRTGNFEKWSQYIVNNYRTAVEHNRGYEKMKQFIYEDDKLIVDYVLKYETLKEDFNNMCEDLNIGPFDLLNLNRTNQCKDYREIHTPITISLTEQIYKEDIETFNYKF